MSNFIVAVPGDECNERLAFLRAHGYKAHPAGHDLAKSGLDLWDIVLVGAPCGGDHPNCLGTCPENEYLCIVCRPFAEMPTELRKFLGV
jgi:hypothetical protein